jgi:phosphate transport system substrate-binding protein
MFFFTTSLRRVATVSLATIAVSFSAVSATIAQTLNGAGATFPKPLYDRYFDAFKKETGIQVSYEAIGSGGGIKQFTAGTVDFGGSDAAMTDAQIQQVGKGVILVPTAGGSVTVTYNVAGLPDKLKLSRTALPAIFSGEITRWNDAKIAKDNPGVKLPDAAIRLVVRADSSGTSFIFSNHLSNISSSFRNKVGFGTTPKWPKGVLTGKGNPGVAATIKQTPNSIGYVESAFATQNKLPEAVLQNRTNRFVAPSLAEANKALAGISFPANFRVFEGDPNDGYPIVGLTWLMVYKQYDPAKAAAVKKMVEWILTKGQALNGSLEYTTIPKSVAQRAIQVVKGNIAAK